MISCNQRGALRQTGLLGHLEEKSTLRGKNLKALPQFEAVKHTMCYIIHKIKILFKKKIINVSVDFLIAIDLSECLECEIACFVQQKNDLNHQFITFRNTKPKHEFH